MKIKDPVLFVDVSDWDYKINGKELKDGGVEGVIVKMGGSLSIAKRFEKHAEEAIKNELVLMVYYWDDIIYNPEQQAEFVLETIQKSTFPIKFVWADQEQWWLDWSLWLQARKGSIPYSSVPKMTSDNLAKHNQDFMNALSSLTALCGVYTGYGFVSSYAPNMKNYMGKYKVWAAHYGKILPKEAMSWETLKELHMPTYDVLVPPGTIAKNFAGHQFTGERVKLPGIYDFFGNRMSADVNVFERNFVDKITGKIPMEDEPEEEKPIEVHTPKEYKTIVNNLNIRRDATIDSPVIGIIQGKNTKIMVLYINGNWAKLKENGWVSAKYIEPFVLEDKEEEKPKVTLYKTTVRHLNVRKCNSISCSVIGAISGIGTIIRVVDIEKGWARLEDGGWVSEKYIEPYLPMKPRPYQTVVNNLNVREDASVYSPILRVLQGIYTPISVDDFSGNWAHLEGGGWVYARYISPVPESKNTK